MGVFIEGEPLAWNQIKKYQNEYKRLIIKNFIDTYYTFKDKEDTSNCFGEEIEYHIISKNKDPFDYSVYDNLDYINNLTKKNKLNCKWSLEYGKWMIEGITLNPYKDVKEAFLNLENDLIKRRDLLSNIFNNRAYLLTSSINPYLGINTNHNMINPYSWSLQVGDDLITNDNRYLYLTKNIRERREKKIDIQLTTDDGHKKYLDCMAFGMGCSCIQVTMQAKTMKESIEMHDLLVPLSAIILSLSASSPIVSNTLLNNDTRFPILSQAVDDRTTSETNNTNSRYGEVDLYLNEYNSKYNDVKLNYLESNFDLLYKAGIPKNMSKLVSSFLERDILIMYQNQVIGNKLNIVNPYKNFISSIWQNVRWKPPTPNESSWRVEFRPCENQITDLESSAYIIFIVLYIQSHLHYKIKNQIPMSFVKENSKQANNKNSVIESDFFWNIEGIIKKRSIKTIIKNIFDIIDKYVETLELDNSFIKKYIKYKQIIEDRSTGKLLTNASFLRQEFTNFSKLNDTRYWTSYIIEKLIK